ncbi:MAG TPA: histidine phosphatase family protein [Dictyobacter sp.]|jgi:broad specificity phosphatase PhoE|nr:histidine phosphatase family protein [Dictyobacter sp.]
MIDAAITRLVLVRHGETLANREFRYIGSRDDALSERGVQQASRLAEALAALPIAAVYSSPLQRAYQTALPIAHQHTLKPQVLTALREGDFGVWEGLSRTEVLARSEGDRQKLLVWEQDPSLAPPEGESFAALQQRVCACVELIAQQHPGQTVVLVSHVGPIKVLLCQAMNAPLVSLFHLFLDPATISVVDWGQRPMLRLFNSHAHLGWDQARWLQSY